MNVTAKAPGKVLLLGEYAVLEGAVALSCAVDRYASVLFKRDSQAATVLCAPEIGFDAIGFSWDGVDIHFDSGTCDAYANRRLSVVRCVMRDVLLSYGLGPDCLSGLRVEIDTSGFRSSLGGHKLGLGSSGATTVALYGAMQRYFGSQGDDLSDRQDILQRTVHLHRQAQGDVGSGVDVATSVYGGMIGYEMGCGCAEVPSPRVTSMVLPPGMSLLAVDSGRATSTPDFLQAVSLYKTRFPSDYSTLMSHMRTVAAFGVEAMKAGDVEPFMRLVVEYSDLMNQLGRASGVDIVSDVHLSIKHLLEPVGAAYKPSGAGGGDLGVAFVASEEQFKSAVRVLNKAGFGMLRLSFATKGLESRVLQLK